MENASKALLMAAGVLLTMMTVTLILFARGKVGEYYASEKALADIDNLADFNAQFTSFDRDDVYGYEIISLTNKVSDYNMRYSDLTDAKNSLRFNPITVVVNFNNINEIKNKIWYSATQGYLFKGNKLSFKQDKSKNELVSKIATATGIEEFYGSADVAVKLGKSIKTILAADDSDEVEYYKTTKKVDEDTAKSQLKLIGINTYNKITGKNENDYNKIKDNLTNKENVLAYYEYNQFKKAKFKCTDIAYDEGNTGRVTSIVFYFTGELE